MPGRAERPMLRSDDRAPHSGRGGRRFKSCHSDQHLDEISDFPPKGPPNDGGTSRERAFGTGRGGAPPLKSEGPPGRSPPPPPGLAKPTSASPKRTLQHLAHLLNLASLLWTGARFTTMRAETSMMPSRLYGAPWRRGLSTTTRRRNSTVSCGCSRRGLPRGRPARARS
jgi:hypothetical protein